MSFFSSSGDGTRMPFRGGVQVTSFVLSHVVGGFFPLGLFWTENRIAGSEMGDWRAEKFNEMASYLARSLRV